ncbi:S1 RNA-binding domain-containing protein [Halalkalibacter sp. APA_J-10(15)]|uniref:CvfB family protein n=1 Tax=unclassified Halalkalibacter TaxID=2893063 RepID=UPI001FF3122C|nr:S1-like domain-containing RNA-binding protein [Halalkalibacter sp. APA_J-10(15)]MCK0471624.1 S1-like domain-containing RNA-binding protein [Halalkalibacter sp. APA_J-10(15)]
MTLKPGFSMTLEVVRKADFGFFVSDGKTDLLLHQRETKGEIEIGDKIDVFLYHDHQQRLAATMEEPLLKDGEIAWLEAVTVKTGHGVFFYNGISRDLFLSMDELPYDRNLWPQPGDKLPLSYTWDKKGRLMAKMMRGQAVEKDAIAAEQSLKNKEITGYAYHFLDDGTLLFSEEGYLAFLHDDEVTEPIRYGQRLTVRVVFVRNDGRVNVTTMPIRSEQQSEDADKIMEYLKQRNGAMPYWDKTPPEDIEARFRISKAKFKRALGKLMKEKKIEQRDGWTYLRKS